MRKDNKNTLIFIILGLVLLCAVILALGLGSINIKPGRIAYLLAHPQIQGLSSTILWQIRLPRLILALIVGMGLAVSGCVFQGILRNPLADPYTLGISGGAALGVSVGVVLGITSSFLLLKPLLAFAGSGLSIFIVYSVSAKNKFSLHSLILTGVIIGFIFSSLVLLLFAVTNPSKINSIMLWLMGDLSAAEPRLLPLVSFIVGAGALALIFAGKEIDILTLGEEKAITLGIDPDTLKKSVFIIASLITACCVSVSGVIGFVGLIIPHVMRKLLGPGHTALIIASSIAGAAFMLICDTIARTIISPVELPSGVITGFFGGIFFLFYLAKPEKHLI
jgi:iron complex transport system permease protein